MSWFKTHPIKKSAERVFIYAWNEFDEGGWLVPALPPPHGPALTRCARCLWQSEAVGATSRTPLQAPPKLRDEADPDYMPAPEEP